MALPSIPCIARVIGRESSGAMPPCMAYVTGLDVRYGCSSVPCLVCVIGLKHPTGMAAHEKYTCTVNRTGGRYVRMDWWISSKYSFRILPSLLAKPPKDILKYLTPDYVK